MEKSKTKSKSSKTIIGVRNKELYEYIFKQYIIADNPITQKDIATKFNITIGGLKNFLFRHKLNKRHYYINRDERIKELYKKGISIKELTKIFNLTKQNIYSIIADKKKNRKKQKKEKNIK